MIIIHYQIFQKNRMATVFQLPQGKVEPNITPYLQSLEIQKIVVHFIKVLTMDNNLY